MENNSEILKEISSPADLKKLDYEQIEILCQEIRNRIIDATSQNGGACWSQPWRGRINRCLASCL